MSKQKAAAHSGDGATRNEAQADVRKHVVQAPLMEQITLEIAGRSPYVQHKFSAKARDAVEKQQEAGPTAKSKKKRPPKDFDALFKEAQRISEEGWNGIAAAAFRKAMISACRLTSLKMTLAKLAVFIQADGFDRDDGTPLVRIHGKPEMHKGPARNANGSMDLRSRPMWKQWSARVTIEYDAEVFTAADMVNLMIRAGRQVGIGEGRHDSRESAGLGWGEFEVVRPIGGIRSVQFKSAMFGEKESA